MRRVAACAWVERVFCLGGRTCEASVVPNDGTAFCARQGTSQRKAYTVATVDTSSGMTKCPWHENNFNLGMRFDKMATLVGKETKQQHGLQKQFVFVQTISHDG